MKTTLSQKFFNVFNTIIMIGIIIVCLYPILYVFMASISNPTQIAMHTGVLVHPLGFSLDAYKRVFSNPSILISYKNTILYVLLGTTINMIMSCIAAYVLSMKHLVIYRALNKFVIFTMFFFSGMIPMFLLIKRMGMLDTFWAILIPSAINTYNMLIIRTSFMSLPQSLMESAKIDGATDMKILLRIVLPLSTPILATMVLYYGVAHWNSWFHAMMYLRTRALYPVQLILREILLISNTESMTTDVSSADIVNIGVTIQYATIVVVTVPILLVYHISAKIFCSWPNGWCGKRVKFNASFKGKGGFI